jgi:hypothetical protein
MKKFEYMELYADEHQGEDEILVDLFENKILKDYGFECSAWSKLTHSVEDLTEYFQDISNFRQIDEVLNRLGQYGWECFNIRAIQHWICPLPQITHSSRQVKSLINERQLSIWLKREIIPTEQESIGSSD